MQRINATHQRKTKVNKLGEELLFSKKTPWCNLTEQTSQILFLISIDRKSNAVRHIALDLKIGINMG